MISKFEAYADHKLDILYLIKIIVTEFILLLHPYWYGGDTPYSIQFDLWPNWLIQYNDLPPIGEAIENVYLVCKSEQHIMTTKCFIFHSFGALLKYYHATLMNDEQNIFKIICQYCDGYVQCSGEIC